MAQRLTKLQVQHLREKVENKCKDKMKEWLLQHPKPGTFSDEINQMMRGVSDVKTLGKLLFNSKSIQSMVTEGLDIQTDCHYRTGDESIVIRINVTDNPAIKAWQERREKHDNNLAIQAEAIMDKAIFIGADEALAMLENF